MRILFTGASSFTGYWFVQALHLRGHEIVAALQKPPGEYTEGRLERVRRLDTLCSCVFEAPFGSPRFLEVIASQSSWDLLCHHGAEVTDYKSPHFDPLQALQRNTLNLSTVLGKLQAKGCHALLLTGTVFEQREGIGTEPLQALSPYGLSKGLTADLCSYYAQRIGMKLGKCVIPNPFGPFEERRFTSYLAESWCEGKTAVVNTPNYVRDNIHVSLLAFAYARFAERLVLEQQAVRTLHPSGYIESQGAFVKRFADALRPRLELPCLYTLKTQTDFSEPLLRINREPVLVDWSESQAWDSLADYYRSRFLSLAVR